MAWTVGSAQIEAELADDLPLMRRPTTWVLLGGLAGAVAVRLVEGSWIGLWLTALGAGFHLVWLGRRGLAAATPPKDGPCFAINSIQQEGPIELVARIVPPKRALLSPLTSSKCVYYNYKVTLLDPDTDQPKETLDGEERLIDFWLKDVTGKIWVESEGIEIDYKKQLSSDLRAYDQMPRAVRERFQKIGFEPFLSPGVRKPVFLDELRLDPGDNVVIRGHVKRRPGGPEPEDQSAMVICKGPGRLTVERWKGPVFIPVPAKGAKRNIGLGVVLALLGLLGLIL
ncbi:MAG: E3 ubiquitin ligase family protein [Candidatus Methylomirabilis sp.]|nr:E3 ubiquitin ligase family protein [Deltaproteobacteria bacterium]